jgi:hypothetical protein
MPRRGAFGVALVLASLTLPAAAQAPLQWKWKVGDTFFIDVKNHYDENLKVNGMDLKESQDADMVLGMKLVKVGAKNDLVFEMTLEKVEFKKAGREDPAMKKMEGGTVELTLDAGMSVTGMKGVDKLIDKIAGGEAIPPAMRKFAESSIEGLLRYLVAEAIVALPAKPAQKGDRWEHKAELNIGPLGTIAIRKALVYDGKATLDGKSLDKIAMTGKMTYTIPKEAGGLPFQVKKADIKKEDYKGTLWFDPAVGRVVRTEIHVKTDMTMSMTANGQDIEADSQRDQTITLRILDKKPEGK